MSRNLYKARKFIGKISIYKVEEDYKKYIKNRIFKNLKVFCTISELVTPLTDEKYQLKLRYHLVTSLMIFTFNTVIKCQNSIINHFVNLQC